VQLPELAGVDVVEDVREVEELKEDADVGFEAVVVPEEDGVTTLPPVVRADFTAAS
jgi:hypothetical protein